MKTQVEGTYKIKVHTPMGVEDGTLKLIVENESLSGTITNSKGTTEFTDGTVKDNEVEFNSKIKTPMGRLKAHVTGKVANNSFEGVAKLPLGKAKIEGEKMV